MSCEHQSCHCHDQKQRQDHEKSCHCHDHEQDHNEKCHCHDRHDHHDHHGTDGACCEHCEAKLHGENAVSRWKIARILMSAVLLGASFFLPIEGMWLLLYSLAPYLLIGYDVLWDALKNIVHGKVFDEQFLMAIATVGAFAIGEPHEGVAVMLFYQTGELLQTLAVGKSRRSIAALMDIRPDTATVLRDGEAFVVSPDAVAIGEILLVRPGERIPLDGCIIKGSSALDTAALTGESMPRECSVGDPVYSGCVNVSGVLEIAVQSTYHESTVNKILELVEHAGEKKAKTESFITRFSRVYTPCIVLAALLLALVPPLALSQPFTKWIYRALVFLVVSCPCALVISIPLSFFGGIGGASRRGVLIKGANSLERLSRVRVMAFDKTGTLTKGEFSITEICSPILKKNELLAIAATLEASSTHPIAQSVLRAYQGAPLACEQIPELAGKGVCGVIAGERYAIGNVALMRTLDVPVDTVEDVGSVLYLARGHKYLGHLVLHDEVKRSAKTALGGLKKQGVRECVMLTGDRQVVAAEVARDLGVTRFAAELLPDQKVAYVEGLLQGGESVAFVGDGVNDAPVLARADVGIAMGALGSDAAIESADVVLMKDDLGALVEAIAVSKKTMRIVRQNIFFALVSKAVILALGALGIANMWLAVFGDVGVMLLAVLNAMRAMLFKRQL